MRRALAVLGAALTGTALLLTACSDGHPQGPAGQVVAKDRDYDCHTATPRHGTKKTRSCGWEYELTTRDRHGQAHEFDVSSTVYDRCRRGSAYPACTTR
ncbi:hypothetical protein [Streptomyces sp. NPDC001508]|uniref:hypothetical protein n=1 Tax=Streptomyces sp. NPDC001508 TaxID=3154656 RepID=UPI0033178DFD